MKRVPVLLVAVLMFAFISAGSAQGGKLFHDHHGCDLFNGDDISIDFEDGTLIIECEEYDDIVEITEDYELYINGDEIEVDRDQKKLLKKYHDSFEDILDMAEEIGLEGARIGARGAKLGIKAVANIVKLVLEDYDSDDLERELEKEADKIEAQAEKLEKKAEKLEDIADDFEKTHRKLRKSIDELDDLEWF